MADELNFKDTDTGITAYAVVTSATSGTHWNGSALEVLVVANWGTYDIPLTETPASSLHYQGDFPAAAAGVYTVFYYKQLGGSPAVTDLLLGSSRVQWTGTAETVHISFHDAGAEMDLVNAPNATAVTAIQSGLAVPGDLMGLAADAITSAKYDESTAFPVKSTDSGATQIARVGADSDTLETLSDQLDTVAIPGSLMGIVADGITSAKYDESTAFPVKSADSGSTKIARTGADSDTLETLSDEIALVPTTAEMIAAFKASTGWTDAGLVTFKTVIKAIYGMALGKITVAGNAYTFFGDDGATELFTLTLAAASRTVS